MICEVSRPQVASASSSSASSGLLQRSCLVTAALDAFSRCCADPGVAAELQDLAVQQDCLLGSCSERESFVIFVILLSGGSLEKLPRFALLPHAFLRPSMNPGPFSITILKVITCVC